MEQKTLQTQYASQSKTLIVRRFFCYLVLALLAFNSIFPFCILIINSTRTHSWIFGSSWKKSGKKLSSACSC